METERRLTPTERLHEVTMAAMTRAATPPEHSVEITRNAKGVAQFEVTVRGYDLDEVLTDARNAFAALASALPYPENGA
jgi:ribosomal protein L12E/L44/L45/RPP1/RPP2